ncbi:MAG: efflux RND transporter periplasmic adaptor subunit, partial [Tannerella sp.]|nr:efflux RND transporter periplasmic adaptor subunit [Tannerella sp.]
MKTKLQITALAAIMVLGACSDGSKQAKEAAGNEVVKPIVKVALVKERPVDQIQEYTATVEAEVTNNIAPSTPVRIESISVEVGDKVAKGQKLVQMDASNLKQIKLQLENQKTEYMRVEELYKVGGVSKSEWEAAKMALDVRETSYKNMLENTSLLSPINGIVTARNYDSGDMYAGAKPVLTVEQIMPVKLLIKVSELYFTKVKKGQSVKIKLDVYGDEDFEGAVNLVYPTIDPATRTFPVEVRVANRDLRIRPGMFARVTLNFGTINHVVIPDIA